MKPLTLALFLFLFANPASSNEPPARPAILGIGSVDIVAADVQTPDKFYMRQLGLDVETTHCPTATRACFRVNAHQYINVLAPVIPQDRNYIPQILFETSDAARMLNYLTAQGVNCDILYSGPTPYFSLVDPDGHRIGFIQYTSFDEPSHPDNQVSGQLIHAGFVVHDRKAEDHFYRDILGFKLYWHGGMRDDGVDDWVDMQVPDGTDWLEYMLNVSPKAGKKELGVMNHIALGVPDIHAAYKQLVANGWKPTEEPTIGRDGKWQLNLYDPDDTRIEFMEFTPTKKPCCSPYLGPHPGSQSKPAAQSNP